MKKLVLLCSFGLLGSFALAGTVNVEKQDSNHLQSSELINLFGETKIVSKLLTPSICEVSANAAYDSVIEDGGSEEMATNAYNRTLKACEAQLKEFGFD